MMKVKDVSNVLSGQRMMQIPYNVIKVFGRSDDPIEF